MTLNSKKVWLKVMGIIMLVIGIVYCALIITLPLGVPTLVGAVRFMIMADSNDEELYAQIKQQKNLGWAIYAIMVIGVIGILGLIFVYCLETNQQVGNVEQPKELNEPQPVIVESKIIKDKEENNEN